MARFLNNVHSEDLGYYEGRLVRKLWKPLIWIHEDKRMEIPIDFESDGASVPRLPLIYDAWGDRVHREAFLHDYGYRIDSVLLIIDPRVNDVCGLMPEQYILRKESIPKEDDDWYFRITIKDHKSIDKKGKEYSTYSYFTYQPMYIAVRICGGSSFHRMKVMDNFQVTN